MKLNENDLLDRVAELVGARTDRQLSAALEIDAPTISRIRKYKMAVGAAIVLRIHIITDWPIAEIKSYVTHGQYFKGE